jgi:hypothetical protein
MGPVLSAALWFFVLLLLMFVLHEVYGPLLKKKILKILLLPGLVSLLLFKIVCCYAVGAKVCDTKLLDNDREIIRYEEPRAGWLGHLVISVVPFFAMALLFCLVQRLLDYPAVVPRSLPEFSLLWKSPGAFFGGFFDFLSWFITGLIPHGARQPAFWVVLGMGCNWILALAPTLRDFKYISLATAALTGLGLLAVSVLGLGLTHRTNANSFLLHDLNMNVKLLLGLATIWLGVSVATVGAWRLYQNSSGGEEKKKKKR